VNGMVLTVCWTLAAPSGQGTVRTPRLVRSGWRRSPRWPAPEVTFPAGELMAAPATCSEHWLQIADVIFCPGRPQEPRPGAADGWLALMLSRFPGCAVAVVAAAGACRVRARSSTAITLTVWGAAPKPLIGGCLAHAWLAAGRPLAALDDARLRVAFRDSAHGWAACGHGGGTSLSFWLSVLCARPVAGPSVSSRERTCPAWGAPTSS
jgi:hypothetical protein